METTTLAIAKTSSEADERDDRLAARANKAAAKFLDRRGYKVLARDWICHAGSANIIAKDEDTLVFVQVIACSKVSKGFPSERVNHAKRDRFEKIAAAYLQENPLEDTTVRFDVISLLVLGPDRAFLRHHVNAFGAV